MFTSSFCFGIVTLAALSVAGCSPSLHVEVSGDASTNSAVGPFDDEATIRKSGDDDWVLFIFDWADSVDLAGSHHWAKRSFAVNLHEQVSLAEGSFGVIEGLITVFYGFNPVPDTEDFFDWEAVEGTLHIDAVDEVARTAEVRLEDVALEPAGADAVGTLSVNAAGMIAVRDRDTE